MNMNMSQGKNWWIEGRYNPVQEELETTRFLVEGEIPRNLNGLYVRNGGNLRGSEAPHYFVGDGMLHGIWLENGQAEIDGYRQHCAQRTNKCRPTKPIT
jgi:carotenoid cleavage dioxygenase-like enzyme